MVEGKRRVAVFDFDGTITRKDTMFDFIRHAKGTMSLYLGIVIFAPMIALMFMKIIDNHQCKQKLLSWYFKGMKYSVFKHFGETYAARVGDLVRPDVVEIFRQRKQEGCTIYVVSASIREWVAPFCLALGVEEVLSTEMEVGSDGRLTGKFSTHNCFGAEKVRRLAAKEPDRSEYYLYAYGDSRGDREMFKFADEWKKV